MNITVEVPDGKKAVWDGNQIRIIDDDCNNLPSTWEQFCIENDIKEGECFINSLSWITKADLYNNKRDPSENRNLIINESVARQFLALMQLYQLRKRYRQGWMPVGHECEMYAIKRFNGSLRVELRYDEDGKLYGTEFLSFDRKCVADKFLANFGYLIDQAGDLL